jgi:hypothetical protein
MITALIAAYALQGDVKPELPAPGKVISDMLAKYAEARSTSGKVVMTQSADTSKFIVESNFQHERPNKVYLEQTVTTQPKSYDGSTKWLLVSNGINFVYDTPEYMVKKKVIAKRERLSEPVATRSTTTGDPKVMRLGDILVAAKRSLGDTLNPFIEFSYQGIEDNASLKSFLSRLSKLKTAAIRKQADGSEVYVITGLFQFGVPPRQDANTTPPTIEETAKLGEAYSLARFEMLVDKGMNLKKFQIVESLAIMPEGSNVPVQTNIVTSWVGDIQVNSKVDNTLFQLR